MSKEDVLTKIRDLAESALEEEREEWFVGYQDILDAIDEYQEELLIDSGEREE